MNNYNEIRNLNPRKIKQKELENKAIDFLSDKKKKTNSKDQDHLSIYSSFSDEEYFYLNPTESLNMKEIVKPGDNFATVLASGDFMLDAIYNGAKKVVTFDLNSIQYFIANLKLFGLQTLSYNDYFNFFSDSFSNSFFSKNVYDKIKKQIPESQIYSFLNILMKQREKENTLSRNNPLFSLFGLSSFLTEKAYGLQGFKTKGSYLENNNSFNKAKELVKTSNISFIKSDLVRLKNVLLSNKSNIENFNSLFDSMYLSNIPEYIDGQVFAKTIDDLMSLLKDDGIISYCCQGVSIKTLNNKSLGGKIGDKVSLRKFVIDHSKDSDSTIINKIQEYNDVTAFNILKEKYDVSCSSVKSLNPLNGLGDKDTFVYVRKK